LLYHFPISRSSQKLRWALAEKDVERKNRLVSLMRGEQPSQSYRTLNPKGVVPTLFWDELTLTDVGPILELLEGWITAPMLRPSDPLARHRMCCWIKRVDEVVDPANGLLTYTFAGHEELLSLPSEQFEAMPRALPNDRDRCFRRIAVQQSVAAPEFVEALRVHDQLLEDVDQTVSHHLNLLGESISLADITVAPYIKRPEHL